MGSLHTDLQKMVCSMDNLFGLVREDGKVTRVVVKTAPGQAREIREIKVVKENCKKKEIENSREEEEEAAVEPEECQASTSVAAESAASEAAEEQEVTKEVVNITTSKADSLTIIVN